MKKILTIFLVMILVMVGLVSALSCGDTITENTILDHDLTDCSGNGIVIGSDDITLDCDGHTIKGDGSENGINIGDLDNVIIKNCNIQNFINGILLYGADNNRIINNAVSNIVEDGIHLHASNNNTIINNAVSNSGGAFHIFDSSNNNTLINNTMYLNNGGIAFDSACYNTLINNTMYLNGNGIWIDNTWHLDCSNNVIYHNNFINNHEQAYVSGGSGNVFDLGHEIGGNYWSDHVCTGNPSDGSQPYSFTGGVDTYPFQDPQDLIDMDKDGVNDSEDNCLLIANPDQTDSDTDGIGDACDNCPYAFNPDQDDSDGDDIGDACDPDVDDETDCDDGTGTPYYCTIQAAIDASSTGDTINVGAGTYTENIQIYQPLTVQSVSGAEVTVIDALDEGIGVYVRLGYVGGVQTIVFKGFTVENFVEMGILIERADSVQIEDNIITAEIDPGEWKWGIIIGGWWDGDDLTPTTGTIKNNEISGCHWYGFDPETMTYEDYPVSGILIWAPNSELFISDNEIYNSDVGLDIYASSGTLITNNNVHDNSYGLVSWNEYPSINYNNIVNNSLEGIYRAVDYWYSFGTGILNAENNWWGTIEKSGIIIKGNITYSPWYDAVFTTKYFAVDENGSVEYDEEGVGGVTITPTEGSGEEGISITLESLTSEEVDGEDDVGIPHIGKFLSIESNLGDNFDEIEIRIYYDDSSLPNGVIEEDLVIYYYNGTNWVPVTTEEGKFGVNVDENYVWAITDHFSDFGIFWDGDSDGDGIPESEDNCPTVYNPGQEDTDSDGIGDACDNCPFVDNPLQENNDGDSLGDACDNCINDYNPLQTDCNSNGVGDVCDSINPSADDSDCDGVDNNCNGVVDDQYVPISTSCGVGACYATGSTSCVAGSEVDSCTEGTPAADDATCDGIDNDCDASVDEDYIETATSCGIGACSANGLLQCIVGSEVDSCTEGTPNPEICDGLDNDCDGIIPADEIDDDNDGMTECEGDCDDTVASCINDCTTLVYLDADGDNYGDPAISTRACDAPANYVLDNTDCDDNDAIVYPGAPEMCDGLDNNCDSSVDEDYPDFDNDGMADCVDPDDDNDGVLDSVDNCPFVDNPLQENNDGDSQGDVCDEDDDNDGILDNDDLCSGTVVDNPTKGLGTNRWKWDGTETDWITKLPKGEGPQKSFSMVDTQGCSCFQILGEMGEEIMGHKKFGCSISVMEEFIAGL